MNGRRRVATGAVDRPCNVRRNDVRRRRSEPGRRSGFRARDTSGLHAAREAAQTSSCTTSSTVSLLESCLGASAQYLRSPGGGDLVEVHEPEIEIRAHRHRRGARTAYRVGIEAYVEGRRPPGQRHRLADLHMHARQLLTLRERRAIQVIDAQNSRPTRPPPGGTLRLGRPPRRRRTEAWARAARAASPARRRRRPPSGTRGRQASSGPAVIAFRRPRPHARAQLRRGLRPR